MTAVRPERDSGSGFGESGEYGTSYGQEPYEVPGAFEAAVQGLADPLSDPLPGHWYGTEAAPESAYPQAPPAPAPAREPVPVPQPDPVPVAVPVPDPVREPAYQPHQPPPDDETVALRTSDLRRIAAEGTLTDPSRPPSATPAPEPPFEGRAARRKAAKRGGGGHRATESPAQPAASAESGAPLSRVEARRQARAQKPGAGVVASRAIGELFISVGLLMLLFVTYQLWWTNVRAQAQANGAADHLQDDWAKGKRNPGTFAPGQGFALLHIPKLDVVVPVAEGIDKQKVLDRGMVGHYAEGSLKTAMPDAKTGNFSVAGHRNTHGEPFRYINRLKPGDPIVVETQDAYYVYKMASILPQTPPSNTSVIGPVPPGSGFTKPGRYITLTTCTPEFTSKYRMIVWGKMVEERPRDKGKPDALVG
ncbi:class E sortase [Streptomyces sp. NPDC091292]|uniref:class E sortase n=1 Tax=Streptomyces sp. NPDC091292 TaxID=3365991 RepID=UPI0037FB34E1